MGGKWVYNFSCKDCDMVEFIDDPEHHRHGDYCTATISGLKTIHADDDYVIRCDSYKPKFEQMDFFERMINNE